MNAEISLYKNALFVFFLYKVAVFTESIRMVVCRFGVERLVLLNFL